MPADEFAEAVGDVHSDYGDLPRMAAVAQIRAALAGEQASVAAQAAAEATQEASAAQRSTAQWTKALAVATAVLALVTTLLVGLTMWSITRATAIQEDNLLELRRQNCIASIGVAAGLAGSSGAQQAAAAPTLEALTNCYRE